ncbi:fatty acyl-AMP ligase [Kitasatospora sp. NPDC094011]|uniref:fatty acyl-AMP ligase n=1 Tax=Kitasatospora sp. NPDC094011 TaxID=3364090 RepID=UPI003806B20F
MSTGSRTERLPSPLTGILARRAEETPERVAYVHLVDGEEPGERTTYRDLHDAVRSRAAALARLAGRTTSAVLMYPTCLEFVRGWLACATAGLRAAPVQVPTREYGVQRLRRIADDAGTTLVLTTRAVREQVLADFGGLPELAGLELVATDELPVAGEPVGLPEPGLSDVALLQYTSGSTGSPKGVMVTHANFWANAEETDALWPVEDDGVMVSWLPFFHDMGLMLGVVLPLWSGRPAYLMAPEAFIRRPSRWLEALARFRGTHTAAPNFAYDLVVRSGRPRQPVDLSRWRVAINGAEPVHAGTVERFTAAFAEYGLPATAMAPAYGLAENTLKVTGCPPEVRASALHLDAEELRAGRAVPVAAPAAPDSLAGPAGPGGNPPTATVMSCGTVVGDTRVRIVDPATGRAVGADQVGEIWVDGPCVTAGYTGREEENERVFRARITGEEALGSYLRTGDMGFAHDGELYVTGRLKDLIIIKGRNHYPQDLEQTVESSHPLLRPSSSAAFPVQDGEREAVVVVVEADAGALRRSGGEEVVAAVREAVRRNHRIDLDAVVLIRRGNLPKTTSGKVRRRYCRELYLAGRLQRLGGRLQPVAS